MITQDDYWLAMIVKKEKKHSWLFGTTYFSDSHFIHLLMKIIKNYLLGFVIRVKFKYDKIWKKTFSECLDIKGTPKNISFLLVLSQSPTHPHIGQKVILLALLLNYEEESNDLDSTEIFPTNYMFLGLKRNININVLSWITTIGGRILPNFKTNLDVQ